jgi:hypothetical protein
MDIISYKVGNKFIYNVYLALIESMQSGHPLEFYCRDQTYDQYDWTVEPEQSLEELMTAYALSLRDEYDRLILLWSGGTDSHTIYNVFKKANIHIDEIIIKASAHLKQHPESHVTWMKTNHYDPTTIITRYDHNDTELRKFDCKNEDWVWNDQGDLFMFGMSTGADGVKHLIERNHAGKKWTAISGFEKPRLVYRNGSWHARHLDASLRQTLNHDHLNLFFLEPLINIKQNHLVKKAVKKHIAENNLPLHDGDWAEAKWPRTKDGYREWAVACGRHLELTDGASILQKQQLDQYWSLDPTNDKTFIDQLSILEPTLQAFLKNDDKIAQTYVKGLFNLASNKDFMRFLNENQYLRHNNQVLNFKLIFSKEYNLGV